MVGAVERILANTDQNALPNQTDVNILLRNERDFLSVMDTIVNKYDSFSETQLKNLKYKAYFLLGFSLLILLLEILFIFKPLSLQIRNTIKKLIIAQRTSEENN